MTKKENTIADISIDLLLFYKNLSKIMDGVDALVKTSIDKSVDTSNVKWKHLKTDIYDVHSSLKTIKENIENGDYKKEQP